MSERERQRLFLAAAALVVVLLALAVVLAGGRRSTIAPAPTRTSARIILPGRPLGAQTPPAPAKRLVDLDPEAHDPALRAAHQRLLRSQPLEQRLPYRDHEIGADIVDVAADGKLVVLVTYIRSRSAARRDIERLMARYHDPGSAYLIRYQSVFK